MDAPNRERFRRQLAGLRAHIAATGPAKIEPARKDAAAVGVADEDEQALTEMLQILASSKNRKQSEELARLDRALRRLAEAPETFGRCEECDEEIAARRLSLMPYATLCTDCQAERDPRRGATRRSLTDYRD